jgi:Flagellar basal body rod protein
VDFLKTMAIAASGLRAQAGRMRIISENIANADSTPAAPGAEPYRRKVPSFQTEVDRTLDVQLVELGKTRTDNSEFRLKYDRPSRRRQERQRQISQRQSAPGNDRHARGPALLRGQYQRDQRHPPHAPAHHRHPQNLKG